MKAVILAAGKGSRLFPLSKVIPKPLIPICNLPTLIFVINKLEEADINELGLVISPDNKLFFENFIKKYNLNERIKLIFQNEALGVAHALNQANDFLENDDFLLYLGDNLIQDNLKTFRNIFEESESDALLLLKEIEDPTMFGVARLNDSGKLVDIEEKPKKPKSNLAVTGLYFFKNNIFDEIKKIKFSERGELEITDAISNLVSSGTVSGEILNGWWIDTGSKSQILEANTLILKEIFNGQYKNLYKDYNFQKNPFIGPNSKLEKVKIKGNAIIGNSTHISNTSLSNGVSISSNNNIIDSDIYNSILLEESYFQNTVINNSLIGAKYKKGVNNSIKDIIDI